MALPDFSMRQLLEAGVHFGHQTHRWNPKMAPYIYGDRNNIHILDLAQTVPLLHTALKKVSDTVARGGRVLFVGTKRQASDIIADAATRSAQYYVNARWLGGMMTNWKTISNSIQRLRKLDELLSGEAQGFTKKERLNLDREREKLNRALGGIKNMGSIRISSSSSTPIRKRSQFRKPSVLVFRLWPLSTAIAILTRSISRSRAMTTRPVPFRFIAISLPRQRWMAFCVSRARSASMSVPRKKLLPSRHSKPRQRLLHRKVKPLLEASYTRLIG